MAARWMTKVMNYAMCLVVVVSMFSCATPKSSTDAASASQQAQDEHRSATVAAERDADGWPIIPREDPSLVIRLERDGYYENCPHYIVEIHGDGLVQYEGVKNVYAMGKRTRQIPVEWVSRLVRTFGYVEFDRFRADYAERVSDTSFTLVSLGLRGKVKTVKNLWSPSFSEFNLPDEKAHLMLDYLGLRIDHYADSAEWVDGPPAGK